jgi:rod shape-determining protein MreD
MSLLNTIALLSTALLVVFLESAFTGVRNLFGAQIDLLPALVVYASLSAGLPALTLLAVVGGLAFDSLSANPLGISVLPLFLIGLGFHSCRELVIREQTYAQVVLGFAASVLAPALTLLLLINAGTEPMVGWKSLWQWLVMGVGGAVGTPLAFRLFDSFNRTFAYQALPETSFRSDRQIKRGRA